MRNELKAKMLNWARTLRPDELKHGREGGHEGCMIERAMQLQYSRPCREKFETIFNWSCKAIVTFNDRYVITGKEEYRASLEGEILRLPGDPVDPSIEEFLKQPKKERELVPVGG